MKSTMRYMYSTKNFHRFGTSALSSVQEVYVPRHSMQQPVSEIEVLVTITNPAVVAEQAKPAKASVRA